MFLLQSRKRTRTEPKIEYRSSLQSPIYENEEEPLSSQLEPPLAPTILFDDIVSIKLNSPKLPSERVENNISSENNWVTLGHFYNPFRWV